MLLVASEAVEEIYSTELQDMPTIVVSVKGIAEGVAVLLLGRTACNRKMNAVSLHCFETRSLTSAVHPSVVFDSTVGDENISGEITHRQWTMLE